MNCGDSKEEHADLADNLQIAADIIRSFQCLDPIALTARQRKAISGMRVRVNKLISSLVMFYERNGMTRPTEDQVDRYR